MHCIIRVSLSKLNELWQGSIKHKPYGHIFLCVHVKELKRLQEMSVLSDLRVGVRVRHNRCVSLRLAPIIRT